MGDVTRSLELLVTGKDVSATKTLRGVRREVSLLDKHGGKAARNLGSNLERGVVLGAAAGVGAMGYFIAKATELETSSASVAKTVGDAWREVVAANKEMAGSIPVDVNELNEISAAAGAMGVEGAADVTSFTKTVALLAETADDLDSTMGAEFLGHLRTNMQLTGPEIERVGDLVTHLGNNSASTEGQILSMAENVSGAAGFIDASTDDVMAWSAAMASAGEEAEAGGSAIQRVWISSAKFVHEGGEELKLLAKVSGVSMDTFRKNFEKDGAGTLADFVVKLGELSEAEQLVTLEALGWGDIRITRAMGKLLANTNNLTNAYEQTGEAAGAMGREAEIRFATTASQVKLLQQNVDLAAAAIGTELLPIVNELAREGVDWLGDHQEDIAVFSKELAANVREAVKWGRSLDWEAIGTALKAGATGAKAIVDVFTSLPPEVMALLGGLYGVNKITGGVVVDIGGDMMKQFFGRGSSPANPLYVVPLGGGLGGPGGAAGRGGGIAGSLLRGGAGLAAGFGGSMLLDHGVQTGGAAGSGAAVIGAGGMIGGGALALGPLGAIIGSAMAVGQTQQGVSAQSSAHAAQVGDTLDVMLQQSPSLATLQNSLAAVETGIHEIESNPLMTFVQGSALDELRSMREKLQGQIAEQRAQTHAGYQAATTLQGVLAAQGRSNEAHRQTHAAIEHSANRTVLASDANAAQIASAQARAAAEQRQAAAADSLLERQTAASNAQIVAASNARTAAEQAQTRTAVTSSLSSLMATESREASMTRSRAAADAAILASAQARAAAEQRQAAAAAAALGRQNAAIVAASNARTAAEQAQTRASVTRSLASLMATETREGSATRARSAADAAIVASAQARAAAEQKRAIATAGSATAAAARRTTAAVGSVAAAARSTTAAVRAKDLSVRVNNTINVTARLSTRDASASITAYRAATGSGR